MLNFAKEDEIIEPKIHQNTLIFLPGWSRSSKVDVSIFKTVPFLENTKIHIVQSPQRTQINRLGLQPSWFVFDFTIPDNFIPELHEMACLISEIIEEEYKICKNLFLGGFSQGGILALFVGLVQSNIPFLGIFALSCFIPRANYRINRGNIPLFIFHGGKDEIVNCDFNKNQVLDTFGKFNLTYKNDMELGHTYSWKEFLELKKWMKSCLSTEKI